MSRAAAQAFIDRMHSDTDFHRQVMAIADVSERIRFINAHGFDCDIKDILDQCIALSREAAPASSAVIYGPHHPMNYLYSGFWKKKSDS